MNTMADLVRCFDPECRESHRDGDRHIAGRWDLDLGHEIGYSIEVRRDVVPSDDGSTPTDWHVAVFAADFYGDDVHTRRFVTDLEAARQLAIERNRI